MRNFLKITSGIMTAKITIFISHTLSFSPVLRYVKKRFMRPPPHPKAANKRPQSVRSHIAALPASRFRGKREYPFFKYRFHHTTPPLHP